MPGRSGRSLPRRRTTIREVTGMPWQPWMGIVKSVVTNVETLACGAGWRNYYFVKLTTSDGIVGWSEYDQGFGNPGIDAIIAELKPRIVGRPVSQHERLHFELRLATRPGTGGVVGQALGAIENALLDAKAKTLGVPCYELLGGKVRDRAQVYWSHCGTWRISRPPHYQPVVNTLDGVKALGREVRERGFKALKTNIYRYEDGRPVGFATGFGIPFEPELNVPAKVARGLREHLEAFRDGAGPDVELLLDHQLQRQNRGLPRDHACDRGHRDAVGRTRHLRPRRARPHPPPEPPPDRLLRNAHGAAGVHAVL